MNSKVNLPVQSMFRSTPVYDLDGLLVFGMMIHPTIVEDVSRVALVTRDTITRLDRLSFAAFDTPQLWWAVAEMNDMVDPLTELEINQALRVPSLESVNQT